MGRYGNEGEQWLQEDHRNNIGKDGHYLGGSTGIIQTTVVFPDRSKDSMDGDKINVHEMAMIARATIITFWGRSQITRTECRNSIEATRGHAQTKLF